MFAVSLILAAALVVLDQCIKILVNNNIKLYEVIEVIHFGSVKIFSLTHIRNQGAAWSIMEGKTWFLVGLPVLVCIAAVYYMFRIRDKSRLELSSIALIIAGGIGNLIDRVRLGEVIDYILFEPIDFPIFNFADICIVIGAFLFAFSIIWEDVRKKKSAPKTESDTPKED